jgi:hypothetical protein
MGPVVVEVVMEGLASVVIVMDDAKSTTNSAHVEEQEESRHSKNLPQANDDDKQGVGSPSPTGDEDVVCDFENKIMDSVCLLERICNAYDCDGGRQKLCRRHTRSLTRTQRLVGG